MIVEIAIVFFVAAVIAEFVNIVFRKGGLIVFLIVFLFGLYVLFAPIDEEACAPEYMERLSAPGSSCEVR